MNGNVKVLVVDDQPASRGLAAIWLSDGLRDRVEVVEAQSLAELRAMVAAHAPDVILLDQRLPDGEGLDGARELLAADPDAAIILLTGMADPGLDEEAEAVGVTDFLVKHEIDGPMLARTVRYALRRREDRLRLRRSEKRYRMLIDALPDAAVLVVDRDLRFTMAAGDALARAGRDPDALIGADAVAIMEAAGRHDALAQYRAALAGEERELENVASNGRAYRSVFRPLGDEVMAVTFDITDQRAQAAELRRAQELARTGSWRYEAATEDLTWSPALFRLYGVDPDAPLPTFARWLTTLVAPEDRDAVVEATRAAQRGTASDFQHGIVRADDGQRRVLHTRVQPVLDASGALVRIEGVSQDVTELRAAQDALRAGEEQLRLVLGNLPRVVVAVYDEELTCRLIEGGSLPSEAYTMLEPALAGALAGEESSLAVAAADGAELELTVAPHRDLHGTIAGAVVVARDVTEQRAAERRFEIAFDRAPIGMFLARPGGGFERVNAALCALSGHDRATLLGEEKFSMVHPDDRAAVVGALARLEERDAALEHRIVRPDGTVVWVAVRSTLVRDAAGRPLHVLGQMQDVTTRREQEAQLRHDAEHDPLTGLLNRRAFEAALDGHVARARRYGAVGAVLLLDLDGFKAINDRQGHQQGDRVLHAVAGALGGRVRETDVLARLGGDEFAVLLPVEGTERGEHVARALTAVVRGLDLGVTASVGVAGIDGATAAELLVTADRAMYAAKAAGGDGVAVAGQRPDTRT